LTGSAEALVRWGG